jgi:hypothetical protein
MLETRLKSMMKYIDGKYVRNLRHKMYIHVSRTIVNVKLLCSMFVDAEYPENYNGFGFSLIGPQMAEPESFLSVC